MAASGPAGLRLEAVAKAAGVSHPTILHHFGSREGLIHALNGKTVEQFEKRPVGRAEGTAQFQRQCHRRHSSRRTAMAWRNG